MLEGPRMVHRMEGKLEELGSEGREPGQLQRFWQEPPIMGTAMVGMSPLHSDVFPLGFKLSDPGRESPIGQEHVCWS